MRPSGPPGGPLAFGYYPNYYPNRLSAGARIRSIRAAARSSIAGVKWAYTSAVVDRCGFGVVWRLGSILVGSIA